MMLEGIPFKSVRIHTAGAVRQGLSLDRLLADSMITPLYGDDRDVVSPTRYLLLCLNTLTGLEDASHGLAKVGLGMNYPAIGSRLILTYGNLESALTSVLQLYSSASSAIRIQLSQQHTTATLSVEVDAVSDEEAAMVEEMHLAWLFIQSMHFLGYAFPVTEVTVRDPCHYSMGRRHWAMSGHVRYERKTSLSFPRRLLREGPGNAIGPTTFWESNKRWLDFVEGRNSTPSISDFVDDNGFVRFGDIARAAGKSPNTVRHMLQTHSGGFRDSRQRALADAAKNRLRHSNDSVETIAAELGYSDGRSFRRFMKNATGMTPQQIRMSQPIEVSPDDVEALDKLRALMERLSI
tara:strand:+ start:1104 stop:2153 length:1050 start_codon:yes stop_codon:yes gene_type:complete